MIEADSRRRTERECERPLSSFCQVTTGRVGALTNFPVTSLIPRSLSGHAKVVNAAPGGRKAGGRSVSNSQPPNKTCSELTISLTLVDKLFSRHLYFHLVIVRRAHGCDYNAFSILWENVVIQYMWVDVSWSVPSMDCKTGHFVSRDDLVTLKPCYCF